MELHIQASSGSPILSRAGMGACLAKSSDGGFDDRNASRPAESIELRMEGVGLHGGLGAAPASRDSRAGHNLPAHHQARPRVRSGPSSHGIDHTEAHGRRDVERSRFPPHLTGDGSSVTLLGAGGGASASSCSP